VDPFPCKICPLEIFAKKKVAYSIVYALNAAGISRGACGPTSRK